MVNPDDKTFDHQNVNSNFGILSITSMGIYNDVNFQISISSITTTQVTVSITKDVNWFVNLKQIGYQIILGIEEVFADIQVLYHASSYSSGTLTQYSNKWLFLSYNGLYTQNNIRTRSSRTSVSQSYVVETWYGTYIKNYHLKAWIGYQFIIKQVQIITLQILKLHQIIQLCLKLLKFQLQEYHSLSIWMYQQNLIYLLVQMKQVNHTRNPLTQLLIKHYNQ